MNSSESKKFFDTDALVKVGTEMLQLVARKYGQIEKLSYPVTPKVIPGEIRSQLP